MYFVVVFKGICLFQQLTGINLMNIYSLEVVFKNMTKLTPIIYSAISCTFNFVCFAIINRNVLITKVGAGRRLLMLIGSAIISPCLILMQILIWLKVPTDNFLQAAFLLTS